jgi:phosphoribosylformimino-5-aminoimidazole carboxamide ribotide isomerase
MKIIPAIDLISGKTVRLREGRYDHKMEYDISPVEAALKWRSKGASMLHVIDLDGARNGSPVNLDIVEKIVKTVDIPVQTGGGYRTTADIHSALSAGVSRVIVGSRAFEDLNFAAMCVEEFGRNVIFSCDVKNFAPQVRGWEESLDVSIFDIIRKFVTLGVKEIIYTDTEKDGTLSGPAVGNIERILDSVDMKIISAGGVKTTEDLLKLKVLEEKGLSGAIVGRALYEGTLDLEEAINACEKNNTVS